MSEISGVVECDFLKYPIQTQGEFKYNGTSEYSHSDSSDFQPHTNLSCEHGVSHDRPLTVSDNTENEVPSPQPLTSDKCGDSEHSGDYSDSNSLVVYSEDTDGNLEEGNSEVSDNGSCSESNKSEKRSTIMGLSADHTTQLRSRKRLTAEEKREKHRLEQQQRRKNELPWEKTKRLQRSAERQRLKRLNLTEAEKQREKDLAKKRSKERRARETAEEREIRRIKDRIRMREKRALIKQVRVLGPEIVAQSCVRLLNPPTPSPSPLPPTPSLLNQHSSSAEVDLSSIVLAADPALIPNSISDFKPSTSYIPDFSSILEEKSAVEHSSQPCSAVENSSQPSSAVEYSSQDSGSLVIDQSPPLPISATNDQSPNQPSSGSRHQSPRSQPSSGTLIIADDSNSKSVDTQQNVTSTTALYAVAKDYLATEHEKYLKQKEKQRIRCRERRANESAEARAVRLRKAAERQRLKRMSFTAQEKVLYNEVNRLRARKRRREESPQQQDSRRSSERVRRREQRALARQVQLVGATPPSFVKDIDKSEGR